MAVYAVRDASAAWKIFRSWLRQDDSLKVHAAALPLAEFTGVIGS